MAKYTPMIEQYLKIKAQAPDAFLFFRLGDFYELFFEDAQLAAEELEITLTGRGGGTEERIPMCGVPYHSANTYIERLIEKGYKVAICEQVEDPSSAKGVVRREIIRFVTPGTVMEESMLTDQENNFLVSVVQSHSLYSLSAVDLSTGEIHLTELQDLSSLLDEILSYQPKELLVEHALLDREDIGTMLQKRYRVVVTPFSVEETQFEGLQKKVEGQFPTFHQECSTVGLKKGLVTLYAYLQNTQKRSLGHLQRLHRYDAKQYMMLDEVARRNLELTITMGEGKKRGSLLGLLDQSVTAMGSRLLKKWLDKPLLRIEEIQNRQDVVAAYLEHLLLLDDVRAGLKNVYDLERLAARISYGSATARDLVALHRSLVAIPDLKNLLRQLPSKRIHSLLVEIDECVDLQTYISKAIVADPPLSVKEGGIIQAGYHEQLDQYRDVQKNGKQWIATLEQQERNRTGIKSLKIGYNRIFGYYIEISRSNLRNLPEGLYERKQTLANAERFITPELKQKEQLILDASEKSMDLEYELFCGVRNHLATHIGRLQKLAEQIAELDVLHAFAKVSAEGQYVRPEVHAGDEMVVVAGRHPVVEALARDDQEFIANDVELNHQSRQLYLITGPNMAGKSTYMRQVALITILSQIGCFVPARSARISLTDRIFTRIGAADDLVGGRSTFMVEMAETCQALREATSRSLILLDEVGRGTSTYDGLALAHAIVEYIHDHVGAKTLFSTHYHELTQLDQKLERLVNVHAKCIEKDGKVVFLHRIVSGGADRSYGIHVAELAGLPTTVIQRAKVILERLEVGNSESAVACAASIQVNSGHIPEIHEEPIVYQTDDPDGQLSLFDFGGAAKKSREREVAHETEREIVDAEQRSEAKWSSSRPVAEEEVLSAILQFDLMNQTPFQTMQFVLELKKKLLK
ncbi:DNA mismatch repair protein MutS [Thermoactinomyces sp. DSM 45892]|uniref:DNA mismatch repair protein MutS n=1 Tax=Thermoactinomyces sp. DSM 45892 TaxID=1882753 RepID=UPI00089A2778|nr:DNA mismatch repair protein MutS [Thermoactinomyces sp. DSM 45892]SDY98897.1 DNA mismatch repair protein MutS [Thermoactinomyces sp. DSM 45892]